MKDILYRFAYLMELYDWTIFFGILPVSNLEKQFVIATPLKQLIKISCNLIVKVYMCIFTGISGVFYFFRRKQLELWHEWQRSFSIRYVLYSEHPNVILFVTVVNGLPYVYPIINDIWSRCSVWLPITNAWHVTICSIVKQCWSVGYVSLSCFYISIYYLTVTFYLRCRFNLLSEL